MVKDFFLVNQVKSFFSSRVPSAAMVAGRCITVLITSCCIEIMAGIEIYKAALAGACCLKVLVTIKTFGFKESELLHMFVIHTDKIWNFCKVIPATSNWSFYMMRWGGEKCHSCCNEILAWAQTRDSAHSTEWTWFSLSGIAFTLSDSQKEGNRFSLTLPSIGRCLFKFNLRKRSQCNQGAFRLLWSICSLA